MLNSLLLPTQDQEFLNPAGSLRFSDQCQQEQNTGLLWGKVADLLWHDWFAFPCLYHRQELAVTFVSGQSQNKCLWEPVKVSLVLDFKGQLGVV